MSEDEFNAVIIGMGPGGETVAGRLISAGRRVAVVERELVGGECAYWACMPSKTLLRAPEARSEAARAAGAGTPSLSWEETAGYRDTIVRHLDDAKQVDRYEDMGVTVVKGSGRISGPGRVSVEGRELRAEHIVIATGSEAMRPPIEGLDEVNAWTNREATTMKEVPDRAVIVGAGAVGLELGQLMRRFGARVTLVQSAERPIDREEPRVGDLVAALFEEEGIDVRAGRLAERARRAGEATVVTLDDGEEIETDVVVVATGRSPRIGDLGLDAFGIGADDGRLPIDEHCRLAEGVWAVGDATGVALFTHVAQYQGRVVADNILGRERAAHYRGIPRVIFTDPEIAAVGLTEEQARAQGVDAIAASLELGQSIARPVTYEEEPRGELGVLADRERGVLVGAWAVAPLASEWIHLAATAVRAKIPISTLLDGVAQFPTYTEAYIKALEALEL